MYKAKYIQCVKKKNNQKVYIAKIILPILRQNIHTKSILIHTSLRFIWLSNEIKKEMTRDLDIN